MLTRLITRVTHSNSVLKAVRAYKGSKIQERYHEFDANAAKICQIKQTLDYETINKESQGCIMIREFLFQQGKQDVQINFRSKYLVPVGKWNIEELEKYLEEDMGEAQTPTELENDLIIQRMGGPLKEKLKKYYQNMGKQNYTFLVKEQVVKISSMSPNNFEKLIEALEAN